LTRSGGKWRTKEKSGKNPNTVGIHHHEVFLRSEGRGGKRKKKKIGKGQCEMKEDLTVGKRLPHTSTWKISTI